MVSMGTSSAATWSARKVEGPGGEGEHEPENNATDHATQAAARGSVLLPPMIMAMDDADHEVEAHINSWWRCPNGARPG